MRPMTRRANHQKSVIPCCKNIPLTVVQIPGMDSARLTRKRAARDRHERCVDAVTWVTSTNVADADGEVVWYVTPAAGVKFVEISPRGDVKKASHQGDREETLKPCAGRPGCPLL